MLSINQILIATFSMSLAAGCATSRSSTGWDPKPQGQVANPSHTTISEFETSDPGLKRFFDQAEGYVVFPTVGKAGIVVGGAYGTGDVFEHGELIGSASITQLTLGSQWGGQAFRQIIFFRDKAALDDFRDGNFTLSAQASAVAVTAGASANATYSEGVAIFTIPIGGLMYEAVVGGQKFSFEPTTPASHTSNPPRTSNTAG